MGCFLYWTATGADSQWVVSALQRVPIGPAIPGATIHEAYCLRYGNGAPLWQSPRLHWGQEVEPDEVAPLSAPLWDLGPLPVRRRNAPIQTFAYQRGGGVPLGLPQDQGYLVKLSTIRGKTE